jgi:carboxy-cis,cis-muconate cyclase
VLTRTFGQRYGSHAIEFTPDLRYAFVPVLGTDTIEVYDHDATSGKLTHITGVGSPREEQGDLKDGPRHLKVHPNGMVLYCVTEHCESFMYNDNMSTWS